jgi:hypothetical protein
MAAIVLAGHPRCGSTSPAGVIDYDTLRHIVELAEAADTSRTWSTSRDMYVPRALWRGLAPYVPPNANPLLGWRWVGGYGAADRLLRFMMSFPACEYLPAREKCPCGRRLRTGVYFEQEKTRAFAVVCKECAEVFPAPPRGTVLCPTCLAPHPANSRRPETSRRLKNADPWCAACRSGVVAAGSEWSAEHEGESFEFAFHSDPEREPGTEDDPAFARWRASIRGLCCLEKARLDISDGAALVVSDDSPALKRWTLLTTGIPPLRCPASIMGRPEIAGTLRNAAMRSVCGPQRCAACHRLAFLGAADGLCAACRRLRKRDFAPCAACGEFGVPPASPKWLRLCEACRLKSGWRRCPACGGALLPPGEEGGAAPPTGEDICRSCLAARGWAECVTCGRSAVSREETAFAAGCCAACRKAEGWVECAECRRLAVNPLVFAEDTPKLCVACRNAGGWATCSNCGLVAVNPEDAREVPVCPACRRAQGWGRCAACGGIAVDPRLAARAPGNICDRCLAAAGGRACDKCQFHTVPPGAPAWLGTCAACREQTWRECAKCGAKAVNPKEPEYVAWCGSCRLAAGFKPCAVCGDLALFPDDARPECGRCYRGFLCALCGDYVCDPYFQGERAFCSGHERKLGWRRCPECKERNARPESPGGICNQCRYEAGWRQCQRCLEHTLEPSPDQEGDVCASCAARRTCLPSRQAASTPPLARATWLRSEHPKPPGEAGRWKLRLDREERDKHGRTEMDRAWAVIRHLYPAIASPANPDYRGGVIFVYTRDEDAAALGARLDEIVYRSEAMYYEGPEDRPEPRKQTHRGALAPERAASEGSPLEWAAARVRVRARRRWAALLCRGDGRCLVPREPAGTFYPSLCSTGCRPARCVNYPKCDAQLPQWRLAQCGGECRSCAERRRRETAFKDVRVSFRDSWG